MIFSRPSRERGRALRLERQGHADLVQAQPQPPRLGLVDAQVLQRLAHVHVGLAAGDDAELRVGRIEDDAVEPVGAGEGLRGLELVACAAAPPARAADRASGC